MDLRRDKFQENIIKDIIRDNDDDVTSLFLNNSGEGDEKIIEMAPMREKVLVRVKASVREKVLTPMREKPTAPVEL
jgi:hypothetical protein